MAGSGHEDAGGAASGRSSAAPAASGGVRPRGRRRAARGDTRAVILAAATAEFSEHGYDAVSMRAVARRAGVDPSLLHHYFDDKATLFTESIGAPIRPDRVLAEVLRGPRDQVGESLVRILLTTLDSEPAQSRVLGIITTALRQPFAAGILRQFLVREVLHQVAQEFGASGDAGSRGSDTDTDTDGDTATGDDGELRATLAASQIVGLIVARYGLRVEPLASAPVDELVHRLGPVIQWHLSGGPGRPLDGQAHPVE
jgi:AcrR family transcriptional regulator